MVPLIAFCAYIVTRSVRCNRDSPDFRKVHTWNKENLIFLYAMLMACTLLAPRPKLGGWMDLQSRGGIFSGAQARGFPSDFNDISSTTRLQHSATEFNPFGKVAITSISRSENT